VNPILQQAAKNEVCDYILKKLSSILIPDKYSDLKYLLDELRSKQSSSALYMAFSKVVRTFGKAEIIYSSAELKEADEIRKCWKPPSSMDKAIRILLLLELPLNNETAFLNGYETLFSAADLGESVALYAALPLLPYPEKLIKRCEEGIRTNMGEVFESVANNNPYPADYLSEDAFNQMVLKCVFIGKPLYRITNLQHRLNDSLARMVIDYSRERWSAKRELTPEIWQLLSPFLNDSNIVDVKRLSSSENVFEKQAAALVCYQSKLPLAQEISKLLNLNSIIENGILNWQSLGKQVWQNQ
jgi:hypothetical protein